MNSVMRSSRFSNRAIHVAVTKLSPKRYKRVLSINPKLSLCGWCKGVMIEPPKAIYMHMPAHAYGAMETKLCAVLVCKKCILIKQRIVRAYATKSFYIATKNRTDMGGFV